MEEQLKEYLVEFIEMLKQGGEFALEQAPLFIHEYLIYYTAFHAFWSIILLSIFIFYVTWAYKYNKKDDWDPDDVMLTTLIGSVIWAPSLLLGFINLFDLIKVILAPRLYLVENLLDIVRTSN